MPGWGPDTNSQPGRVSIACEGPVLPAGGNCGKVLSGKERQEAARGGFGGGVQLTARGDTPAAGQLGSPGRGPAAEELSAGRWGDGGGGTEGSLRGSAEAARSGRGLRGSV